MRGALFENLVISELVKYRYNQGKHENLSFFRDAKGYEIDVLYRIADGIVPIEIKSASTVNNAFFSGLKYFHEFIRPVQKRILIYDGDRNEQRSNAVVTNIFNFLEWFL